MLSVISKEKGAVEETTEEDGFKVVLELGVVLELEVGSELGIGLELEEG